MIQKIISTASDRIFRSKIQAKADEVAKYVQIPPVGLDREVSSKLTESATTLANYLKQKSLAVKFKPEHLLTGDLSNLDEMPTDVPFMRISLLDLKQKGRTLMSLNIPNSVEKSYDSVVTKRLIFSTEKDNPGVIRDVQSLHQDNFTRHIYRIICDMVEQVKGGKK